MNFSQIALYLQYGSFMAIGIILGRLSMAIQYALMKPRPKK